MDAIVYDALSRKNYQVEKFLSSGTFTAKVTGVHFINGCGGGSSGGGAAAANSRGGGGGAGCQMYPVFLAKGQDVVVTIGAGGVWTSGVNGSSGNPTSFGSFITLPGGSTSTGGLNNSVGGSDTNQIVLIGDARKVGFLIAGANGTTGQSYDYTFGRKSTYNGGTGTTITSPATYYYGGGGGGFYGPGGDANNAGVGQSAANNSGAGGGAGTSGGGSGGSGYLEVIYFI